MSMSLSNLRDPRLIAVVAVLLVGVVVVNVLTFKPTWLAAHDETSDVEFGLTVPDDLEYAARLAGRGGGSAGAGGIAAADAGGLARCRDPFQRWATPDASGGASSSGTANKQPVAPAGPTCQAILLSGGQPRALIDGRTYGLGDAVGSRQLVSIAAEGVRLRGRTNDIFLPVSQRSSEDNCGPLVNGSDVTGKDSP